MKTVYIGLGSNVGDREAELRRAVRLLDFYDLRVKRVSSVYETEPMYEEGQGKFLNAVVEAATSLFPVRLLLRLQNIERTMGRKRSVPNAPRNIDLDILLYLGCVMDTPSLRIPHPGLPERRFALEPLAELAADVRHPVTRQTIAEMLSAAPDGWVRRTEIRLA